VAIRLKTEAEIEVLREGGRRLARALAALAKMVVPGANSVQLEEAGRRMLSEDGDRPAFLGYRPPGARKQYPAAICVSVNHEIVHGVPNLVPKVFQPGDVVKIDAGLVHRGLITDSAVTVAVPPTSKAALNLIAACKKALKRGIAAAKAGKRVGDISAAIGAEARKANLSVIAELAGHGVGYALHEDPYVPNEGLPGKGPLLQPGMVIAIEPIFATGGARIRVGADGFTYETTDGGIAAQVEHTIAVTLGEPLILTAK